MAVRRQSSETEPCFFEFPSSGVCEKRYHFKMCFHVRLRTLPPKFQSWLEYVSCVFAGMVPFFTRLDACDFLGFNFDFLGEGG